MNTTKVSNQAELGHTGSTNRLEIFSGIHKYLTNGIRYFKSNVPRNWLKEKGLSVENTFAVFNSGQIHHHKAQSYKDELHSIGFLTPSHVGTNAGQNPYSVFGLYSIIFPLKDDRDRIVNFYALGIDRVKRKKKLNSSTGEQGNYLNQEGIYPAYPQPLTKKLFITETIFDAATLLESKILDNREAVIALHEGELLPQHKQAIENLNYLEGIVFIESINKRDV